MSNVPPLTSPLFATDEDLLIEAGGDFGTLTPPWQQMAAGTDGVFAAGLPWVLGSASVDFVAQGVAPNMVCWLTAPKGNFPGGGHFLAVDSVSSAGVTLRRPYQALNVGQPPAPAAGLSGVAFNVLTLNPQIEESSYEIKQRFAIDDNALAGTWRASSFIYDLKALRRATVFSVLVDRYTQEQRQDKGDFALKAERFRALRDRAIEQLQIRWGPTGTTQPPTASTSSRLSR